MIRTKLAAASTALALLAVPLAASPAAAQKLDLPCENFAHPYGYPCGVAEQTGNFALVQAGNAIRFVFEVRDEAGEVVFAVYCIAFPNQPECQ